MRCFIPHFEGHQMAFKIQHSTLVSDSKKGSYKKMNTCSGSSYIASVHGRPCFSICKLKYDLNKKKRYEH